MLGRLGRSHFALLSTESSADTLPGPALVPIDIRILDARVVVTRVRDRFARRAAGTAAGADRDGDRRPARVTTGVRRIAGRDERGRSFESVARGVPRTARRRRIDWPTSAFAIRRGGVATSA